ncbi:MULTISPECIES: class I SAM-dependent methyltransferase [unclassified Guyparkeria]|uniref:class I SAM-dependent methyltransferase n=1 Tax=unclassified Guyparkeria TaxID=2626246 RepID=UPI00073388DF|nr:MULTISPECIES: class I SAM-dependent methyltransferase [unclassified Guyparkeria]KTG17831.1 hypothetical protein AUR63_06860 [Guyparkeria sp. XI15]OAE89542.1 hypothetical protein AWR35_06870 [Guyparkeria sp. WRN-7]
MRRYLSLISGFAVLALAITVSVLLARAYIEWSGNSVPPWLIAMIAGALGMLMGWALLPTWWRGVLLIAPLVVWGGFQIHPGWFLAAAVLLFLVQFNAIRHQVPLYRSGRPVIEALADEIESRGASSFADLGCGDAHIIAALAARYPDCRFTGFETAPVLYLLARWRCRHLTNCAIRYTDFWSVSWSRYDMVFAFLSPQPMLRLWRKCQRELAPQASMYSLAFEVPGVDASEVIEAGRFDLLRYAVLPKGGVRDAGDQPRD